LLLFESELASVGCVGCVGCIRRVFLRRNASFLMAWWQPWRSGFRPSRFLWQA